MANQTYTVSIKRLIVRNVVETLKRIKKTNGFDNNIAVVEEWQESGNDKAIVPGVFVHSEVKERKDGPGMVSTCVLSVILDVWIDHDNEKFERSTDEMLDTFESDIHKAMMADYTRGGYAELTEQSGPAQKFKQNEGAATCGIICRFDVRFKHLTGDTKTQF